MEELNTETYEFTGKFIKFQKHSDFMINLVVIIEYFQN